MAFGTVWLLIDWITPVGDYTYNCNNSDCTTVEATMFAASEVIVAVVVLALGYGSRPQTRKIG